MPSARPSATQWKTVWPWEQTTSTGAPATSAAEVVGHLGEELADGDVELADLADLCRGGWQHRRDPRPQTIGVGDGAVGDQIAGKRVPAWVEVDQNGLDGIERGPGDHPDHAHGRLPHRFLVRGSTASRNPSPSRLKPITAMMIARDGNASVHQAS